MFIFDCFFVRYNITLYVYYVDFVVFEYFHFSRSYNIANYTRISALILISNSLSVNAITTRKIDKKHQNYQWKFYYLLKFYNKISIWYIFRMHHDFHHWIIALGCTKQRRGLRTRPRKNVLLIYIATKTFISPKCCIYILYIFPVLCTF